MHGVRCYPKKEQILFARGVATPGLLTVQRGAGNWNRELPPLPCAELKTMTVGARKDEWISTVLPWLKSLHPILIFTTSLSTICQNSLRKDA